MLFLKHIIYEKGRALEIVSDRDSKFNTKFWTAFHAHLGTALKLSSARHQAMDKTTERMIAFVKKQRAGPLLTGKITGSNFCPRFSSLLTAHLRKATGLSPYYIEKGRHAAMNLDRDNILRRGDSPAADFVRRRCLQAEQNIVEAVPKLISTGTVRSPDRQTRMCR